MKKLFITLLCLTILSGCEKQPPPPPPGMICHRASFGEVICYHNRSFNPYY